MNNDSLALCEGIVKENGLLLINSSLVRDEVRRKDLQIIRIEATGIAERVGNGLFANMVAMGAMAKLTGALALNKTEEILRGYFPPDKQNFIPMNVKAIEAGVQAV
jgi:2-oxoglutarate ferredoxin oxidoreductase subunit gamma